MTTENQKEEVQEVTEQVEETQETQEVSESTESVKNPPGEGEAEKSQAEKEESKKRFWERQQKYKEQADEAERLKRENEYLRQKALQNQNQEQQAYKDPNEPDLDVYLENGRTAQDWSRDHKRYLDNQDSVAQQQKSLNDSYSDKMKKYSEQSKDIFEYEKAVVRTLNGRSDLAQAIMKSDKAPQLVEAIALKPELADDLLYARDHYELARSMINLENSVEKKPSFSDAPKPKSERKSEPAQSGSVDLSKLDISFSEYKRQRNRQRI